MSYLRKIDALFIIAIIIFAGLFYSVFHGSKISRESNQLVTQAHEILYHLERVESAISVIEAAHRGFIISGREEFLDPVANEKNEISSSLMLLDSMIGESQEQIERLQLLSSLLAKKIAFSEKGIGMRRGGSKEVALNWVSSGRGKLVMDSIRTVSKELEREEINLLNEKSNENEALAVAQARNYLLFAGFIFVLLVGLYLRVRKNTNKLIVYRKKQDELIKELNYQNRQLDDFAHLTSHNIRSPATNIATLISFLDERSSLEEYQEIYSKLKKVSHNLNETLNELIEVLHVKNNPDIKREVIAFESVFNKVKESMQGDILMSNATISSDFAAAPTIYYPKTYLESIFHNLLSNALKYRSPDRTPEIHVRTQTSGGDIVLQITDNGLGIDLQRYGTKVFGLRKVFHTTENAKGIGLFMTKTQVEALGGEISVKSEVNKGSTFTVTFDAKSSGKPVE